MGLDMYLYGKLTEVREDGAEIIYGGHRTPLKSYMMTERQQLAYWRKHWNLHNAIVNQFGDGVDEMQDIELSADQIDAMLGTLIEADEKIDREEAGDYSHWTPEIIKKKEDAAWELLRDIRAFAKARVWLLAEKPGVKRRVVYNANW